MPGAWEVPRPNVLMATLTRELVSTKWAAGYRALQLPSYSAESILSGMPFDHARNTACENVLASGFTWLFFLDDDVVAPPNTIQRLINHGQDIVSGLYYRRAAPIVPVMMTHDDKGNSQWITSWPQNHLIEVDLVGAGCLLIHRRVLEQMSRPWFDWQLDKVTPNPCRHCGREATMEHCRDVGGKSTPHEPSRPHVPPRLSEDFAFCRKAKKEFGFKIHVDTSIVCEHIGLGQSGAGGGFVPSSV